MVRVAFYEVFREEEVVLKRHLAKSIQASFTWKTIQEDRFSRPRAPLVSIRTQSRIPLSWAGLVQGVLTRSRGFDHLLGFRQKALPQVPCGYLPDYCSQAVAEHAVMVMMVLLKRLKKQIKQLPVFSRDDLTGLECLGRRVLVIGVGHIGYKIVKMADALGMQVRGVDIVHRSDSVKYVSLDRGLRWADVIVCALPLTERTRGLLNYRKFNSANPGIVFINIARGEISPLKDIQRLIKEKFFGGLCLDVYENEDALAVALRSGRSSMNEGVRMLTALVDHDNVLLTPHNAFNTQEALERKAKYTVQAIEFFLKHKRFQNFIPTTK